eukprot:267073-Amphidinium_carterae.1
MASRQEFYFFFNLKGWSGGKELVLHQTRVATRLLHVVCMAKVVWPNSAMSVGVPALVNDVADAAVQTIHLPQQIADITDLVVLAPAAVYVVWRLEGSDHPLPGVHFGPCAWQGITSLIPGFVYRVGADRLRRVRQSDSEESTNLFWYWGAELEDKLPSKPVRRRCVQARAKASGECIAVYT